MTSQAQGKQRATLDLSAYKELFLQEALASLSALRQNLTRLVDDPTDGNSWREAHRAAHTLKGMASTMRYEELTALAKQLESPFLSEAPLTPSQIKALLAGCDGFEIGLKKLEGDDDRDMTYTGR